MDPFYFTTDLDYAFGAGSGFNPGTDAQAQTARGTSAAKSARAQKPAVNKRATASKSRRLNYDGMSFNDAFAAARRAGLGQFNWRGKAYTTQLDEGPTQPYVEQEPFVAEKLSPFVGGPVSDALAVQSDGSNALNKARNPYLGMRLPIQAQGVQGYGYGGFILPDIILY